MPFKKQRDIISNKKQRKPGMKTPTGIIEFNDQLGDARKARSRFDEKLSAEDIDDIPGIEILNE